MSKVKQEIKNEYNERYESVELRSGRQFLDFVEKMKDFELTSPSLLTLGDAEGARRMLLERYLNSANTIEGVNELDLTLSGDGVVVPNISTYQLNKGDESQHGFMVTVDNEAQTRKLELAEDIPARFEGFLINIDNGDLGFRLKTSLIVRMGQAHQFSMDIIPELGVPMVAATTNMRALVALDGSAHISVDALELERRNLENKEMARRYSRLPYVTGAFGKHLNRLELALQKDNKETFTSLNNPRIIRALGRTGAENASESSLAATVIEDSLLLRIGQNRELQIVYSERSATNHGEELKVRKYVKGRLLHVAVNGIIGEKIPRFVLDGASSSLDGRPEYGVHYVPFTQVEQFSF